MELESVNLRERSKTKKFTHVMGLNKERNRSNKSSKNESKLYTDLLYGVDIEKRKMEWVQ